VLFVNKAKSHALAGHPGPLRANVAFNGWRQQLGLLQLQPASQLDAAAAAAGAGAEGSHGAAGCEWQSVRFVVPADAYEMHFALSDGNATWDNNDGA
jgi:hypothetical protein